MVASPDYFLNPVGNSEFRLKSGLKPDFGFQIRIKFTASSTTTTTTTTKSGLEIRNLD
jgi:hypothetical protein